MSDKYYELFVFKGTHREVGRQNGEARRAQIRQHLDLTYDLAQRVSNISKEKALETAVLFKPYINQYAPGFLEEIEGLGEGAGISEEEALLLQVRQEVVHLAQFGSGFECTSYAVGAPYTKDGKVYSGQNADLAGDFESISAVIRYEVEGKPRIMMVAPAGQISYIGMNDRGVGANCNFLSCDGWKRGYPRYLISRLLLEQPDFDAACNTMVKLSERASSRNVLLSDRSGNIADFETTADDYSKIYAEGLFVHSNHFVDPEMQRYERATQEDLIDSCWRRDRLNTLLENNKGEITPDLLKKFLGDDLRDPETGKFSICTHACGEAPAYHTFASTINHLADGVMEVSKGNPCSNPFKEYSL
ncbi:MAG: C45 family peptidase [Clostridiales Family XIII bacterium]|jgi:predicted choloylglycine hydrolase|nr:C45 family peptidase [Clostridiales Family XIII bacterium]